MSGNGGSTHNPCKACPAVFTSRAALRRHLGEIHGQGASGTCVCDQCGKIFQTKSNLKIHLLTHSGVKPFKYVFSFFFLAWLNVIICAKINGSILFPFYVVTSRCPETECGLGFSTKQCLQVHLRKAHGFSEDTMPQVQRSIPYTFDAYSGGVIKDPGRGKLPDFPPPTTPTRLHQQLDQTGQQVLFDSIDVIVPPFFFHFMIYIFFSFFLFFVAPTFFAFVILWWHSLPALERERERERESPIIQLVTEWCCY